MTAETKTRRWNCQPFQVRLNANPSEIVNLNLRLEPPLHADLKQAADAACRSLQGEIIFRLRKTMPGRKPFDFDDGEPSRKPFDLDDGEPSWKAGGA
jgi:hypothetical protein